MLKIVYPICCGIDVHKKNLLLLPLLPLKIILLPTKLKKFTTYTNDLLNFKKNGYMTIIVMIYVWKALASTGLPFLTSSKIPVASL